MMTWKDDLKGYANMSMVRTLFRYKKRSAIKVRIWLEEYEAAIILMVLRKQQEELIASQLDAAGAKTLTTPWWQVASVSAFDLCGRHPRRFHERYLRTALARMAKHRQLEAARAHPAFTRRRGKRYHLPLPEVTEMAQAMLAAHQRERQEKVGWIDGLFEPGWAV